MRKENGKRESPYKGILKFADEKKPQLSFAVVLSVLSSAFGIVPYIAVAILLQKALASSLTTTWAILLPVIALCGYLLKHTLYAKSTLCSHKVAYEIIKNIRTTIMKKMSKVSMGTIQGKSSGEFKQLVIDDAERLEGPLAHAIPEMTASILVPIFVILYLLVIDWRMALAALVSAILGNLIYYGMMFGRGEVMKEYMMSNANMNATIVEYVNGMEVIKAFNQTASSMGRFQSAVLKVRDITTKWYKHCWPFMSISQAILPSSIAFVLPVGMALISGGTVSLAELIVCILLSMAIVGSLQNFTEFWESFAVISEVQPRIQALLDMEELTEPAQPKHTDKADMQMKDVHFGYGDSEIIHGISFTAKAGSVTAFVGPSGSGKSTLAKLIARFWDVDAGAVLVGGIDIREMSLILMIKQQHGYVRCVDVAEQLGVKKPSVSRAVKELIKSGHLVKNADGTLSLTELGLQIAEQIYEKHLFFTKQLILAGVDPETAEQDACGIEHAVSSESFQKLKKAFDDG